MSDNRIASVLKGQSVLAQKVYEFVPEGDPWLFGQIKAALEASGSIGTIEYSKLRACLSALKDANLISEPTGGRFRRRKRMARISLKAKEPAVETPQEVETPAPAPVLEVPKAEEPEVVEPTTSAVPESGASLDLFSELAAELVALGEEFNARIKDLSGRIEEAALRREEDTEQAEKFKRLQDFMRGL